MYSDVEYSEIYTKEVVGKRGSYRACTVTQTKVKYTQSRWWGSGGGTGYIESRRVN